MMRGRGRGDGGSSPDLAMGRARELLAEYKKETEGRTGEELGMPREWPREEQWIDQWRNQVGGLGGSQQAASDSDSGTRTGAGPDEGGT